MIFIFPLDFWVFPFPLVNLVLLYVPLQGGAYSKGLFMRTVFVLIHYILSLFILTHCQCAELRSKTSLFVLIWGRMDCWLFSLKAFKCCFAMSIMRLFRSHHASLHFLHNVISWTKYLCFTLRASVKSIRFNRIISYNGFSPTLALLGLGFYPGSISCNDYLV